VIFSAGLSPAWQQIMQFENVDIGEVNRAREVTWCASGKVLNVAIATQRLGLPGVVLSSIGGPSGDAIRGTFDALNEQERDRASEADSRSCNILMEWIDVDSPTRVCTTLLEENGTTTELVENVGPVTEAVLMEFMDKFRIHAEVADVTVLTGSMPSNTPVEYAGLLIREITKPIILDYRGEALLNSLPYGPFLVKPNREELAATLGVELNDHGAVIDGMNELNRRGAEWVVVSDGPGPVLVTGRDGAWRITPPKIDVVNPIGSGDCLAAGIAHVLGRDGLDDDSVLRSIVFGMGAAGANAMQLLPVQIDEQVSAELSQAMEIEPLSKGQA